MTGTNNGTIEFTPKTYGRRLTGLYVVRTLAIWCVAAIPISLELGSIVWHSKRLGGFEWAALACVLLAAIGCQFWALAAWRRTDLRKVTWNPQTESFSFSHHRFVKRFFSFGQLVENIDVAAADISQAKLVRGKGQFLRLQTCHGFVCVTNDLQPFERLCQLFTID